MRRDLLNPPVATAACELDGVTYSIVVKRDADGVTHLAYFSDPPPEGMHRERYSWTGRLDRMRS